MKKILILIVCVLFCSCHSESVVIVKEPSAIDARIAERDRWEVIAIFVQSNFDTGDKSISEIAADLSLALYYMEIEKAK